MPSMADITVKKADGTTDIVYNQMAPSSGDGVSAIWRNESGGAATAFKPMLTLQSKYNGPKTARRLTVNYSMPQTATDSTTGLTSVVNTIPVMFTIALPVATPQTTIDEAVHQLTNLLSSTLVRSCLKAGFAPS